MGELGSGLDEEEGKWGLKAFTEEMREGVVKSCVFPRSSCDYDFHFTPPQKLLQVTCSVSKVRETVGESNSLNLSESVILCHCLITLCYVMYYKILKNIGNRVQSQKASEPDGTSATRGGWLYTAAVTNNQRGSANTLGVAGATQTANPAQNQGQNPYCCPQQCCPAALCS